VTRSSGEKERQTEQKSTRKYRIMVAKTPTSLNVWSISEIIRVVSKCTFPLVTRMNHFIIFALCVPGSFLARLRLRLPIE
jgi:hypothetical protein